MPGPSIQGRDNPLESGSTISLSAAGGLTYLQPFNYEEILRGFTEARKAKAVEKPKPYDDLVDEQAQVIATLQTEIAGLKALRLWEEERLQEQERESWTTY